MITFRPVEIETDAPALARIYNCTVTEPVSPETIRDMWVLRPGEVNISTLAVDENGNALGYWYVDRETHMRPGHWLMGVVVAPEARGSGVADAKLAGLLWRLDRRKAEPPADRSASGWPHFGWMVGLAGLLQFAVLLFYYYTAVRFMADFYLSWMLVAIFMLWALDRRLIRRPWLRSGLWVIVAFVLGPGQR